jgi:PAS domain S-box-containing protein
MNESLRILYLDDSAFDRELVRDSLEREQSGFILSEAASRDEFDVLLNSREFDLILSDFNILGFEGLDVIRTVREKGLAVPVVIVTGTGSEIIAAEAIKNGAADYVIKTPHHIRRLPHTIRNVIDRYREKTALRESEQRYRILFETMAEGVVYQDGEGRITSVNPAAEKILGMSLKQMKGRALGDPVWGAIREDGSPFPRDQHPSTRALKSGKPVRNVTMGVLNARKKTRRWILVNAVPLFKEGDARPSQVYTTFSDITPRKNIEEQQKSHLYFFETLVDTIPNPVFYKDRDGRYQGCNRAFAEQILGLPKSEIVGRTMEDLNQEIPPDLAGIYAAKDRDLFEKDGIQFYEEKVRCADGRTRLFRFNKAAYKDASGVLSGLVGVMVDVTDIREAEIRIKASLLEKEVMLREIHHRVKNNMQIIISMLRLQEQGHKDKRIGHSFRIAQNRIRSMALIHERLYQTEDLAHINFAEYSRQLITHQLAVFHQNAAGISLEIDADDLILDVNEAIPLGLIFNELTSNALQHAFPEGKGTVRILLKNMEENEFGDDVFLEVRDDGCGLPEDFDPDRLDSLGLQLVYDLVKQIDGRITFLREEGTIVRISFKRMNPL